MWQTELTNYTIQHRISQSWSGSTQVQQYLDASTILDKASTLAFIAQYDESNFFSIDLIRQQLLLAYNLKYWQQYLYWYAIMPHQYLSQAELCAKDTARLALRIPLQLQINYHAIFIHSSLKPQCQDAAVAASKQHLFSVATQELLIANLLNSHPKLHCTEIASMLHSNNSATDNTNKLLSICRNILLFNGLTNSTLANSTQDYLYAKLSSKLAINGQYTDADNAFLHINKLSNIADYDYEWHLRTLLALKSWKRIIDAINNAPLIIQHSQCWQYWLGFSYQQLKHNSQSRIIWAKIENNFSYYALLAKEELHRIVVLPQYMHSIHRLSLEPEHDKNIQSVNLAFELYRTNDVFLMHLAKKILVFELDTANQATIAHISAKAQELEWYDISIYASLKLIDTNLALSFPIPYYDNYQQASAKYNINISYLLAISRQESRFNTSALAIDGGVGLMQIMPNTALAISRQLKIDNCYNEYVCNINFGTWYLYSLLKIFNNHLIYAAAAYNAGPSRAKQWQHQLGNLDQRIELELLPFTITRNYVQHILANQAIYSAILHHRHIATLYRD